MQFVHADTHAHNSSASVPLTKNAMKIAVMKVSDVEMTVVGLELLF